MAETRSVQVRIAGRVQGVSFRVWTERRANALGLSGWVRNLPDGDVEAVFSGPAEAVDAMLAACREGRGSREWKRWRSSARPSRLRAVSRYAAAASGIWPPREIRGYAPCRRWSAPNVSCIGTLKGSRNVLRSASGSSGRGAAVAAIGHFVEAGSMPRHALYPAMRRQPWARTSLTGESPVEKLDGRFDPAADQP